MTKVVYNACYGGFGLSKEACQRYWDIRDQQVWIEEVDGLYRIDEYDGSESVVCPDGYDWENADDFVF